MAAGIVKWFSNEKKYGFILVEDKQVFVHFSDILKEGYKTLKTGQQVECEIIASPRGDRAVKVKILPVPVSSVKSSARRDF